MKIKWNRILGFLLLGLSFYLAGKLWPFLGNLIETVNQDWGYSSPIKALMLGVLCLTILAAIKLILKK